MTEPTAAVLLDTGLTNMMIVTPGLSERLDIEDDTEITLRLMGGRLHYSFRANDKADPVTPRRVTWTMTSGSTPTINTGLRTLAAFDYLYDAEGGFLGLRPTLPHR